MNLFNTIYSIFPNSNDVIASEKFSSCSISYYISNFAQFSIEELFKITSLISDDDKFSLSFKIGENDSLILKSKDITAFFQQIIEERKIIDDELVLFNLEIKKSNRDSINIYDYKSFENFWNTTSLVNILKIIKENQTSNAQINFILHEPDIADFYSRNLVFSSKILNLNSDLNNKISENCHFGNVGEYPFNAHYFHLLKRPSKDNSITDVLDKLSLMFCIISIFDITSIQDSKFYYKLNGFKSFEGYLDLDKLDKLLNEIYFKIFDWIYSENSKISDKIGLTRNIISLSLKEENIAITESIYLSIQSGYKAYLQENISKYIEIRNKIVDELSWISQKAGEIIGNYLSNYQKSIFTFLSFFISVFILRFLNSNNVENVFSKDVTIFSLAFLFLSIIFLAFSIWNIKSEKNRLKRKYDNLKKRYTDLLDANDIKRILKDDEEFNYELDYIDRQKKSYTILWITTIIVLISTVLSVSSYLNWKIIYNSLIECFSYFIHKF